MRNRLLPGPDGKDRYLDNKDEKATRSRGTLRLTRTGSRLHYRVAEEGQEFRTIQSVEIGTENVKTMKVLCNTMYTPIAMDVRLTRLEIHADKIQIPNRGASIEPPAAALEKAASGWWLLGVEFLALAIVVSLGIASGLWLYIRQTRRAEAATRSEPPAATISFVCQACGKNLKARRTLAGKKVRCSGCGKAVRVPERTGEQADGVSVQ